MNQEPIIVTRNKDVEHIVNAAANQGHYSATKPKNPRFTLLCAADVHHSVAQMANLIDYLNAMDAIDAGIHLGDMQAGDYAQNDGTWYTNEVARAEKPFFSVVGNHDGGNSDKFEICGTVQQVFDKFFAPVRDKTGVENLEKPYYAKNFDEYGVTVIVLNNYDAPDDLAEDGNFAVSRGVEAIRQEQMDWFVKTLTEIPEGYHLIVARHAFEGYAVMEPCSWTQVNRGISPSDRGILYGKENNPVADIVDAWVRGGVLRREYPVEERFAPYFEDLKVDVDFTDRGPGNFVCHLLGHCHRDGIAHVKAYPNQKIVSLASACSDRWQNEGSDLPRYENTKAEDCLTTLSVDPINRNICLVRVGSNITNTMVDRTFIAIPY